MNLLDWLLDHCKAEDINKERFGLLEISLNREKTIKDFNDEIENRYKKSKGDLPPKILEQCSKRTGVPKEYIQNRMLNESITYFILIGDTEKSDQLFAKAINNGSAEATFQLATYHSNCGGSNSDSLEFFKAITQLPPTIPLLYDKLTSKINGKKEITNNKVSDAMYMCGSFFLNAIGTEQDYQQAIHYYEMGCALDDMKCFTDLGLMYAEGLGQKDGLRNLDKALELLKKSSQMGDPVAKYNYGVLLFDNNIDHQEAIKWIKESADEGVQDAKSRLKHYQNTYAYLKKNKKVIQRMVKKELNDIIQGNTNKQLQSPNTNSNKFEEIDE